MKRRIPIETPGKNLALHGIKSYSISLPKDVSVTEHVGSIAVPT